MAENASKEKSKRGGRKKAGKIDSDTTSLKDDEMSTSRSKVALADEDEDEIEDDEMMLEDDDDMLGDDGEMRYDESESGMNVDGGGEDDDDMDEESIYSGMPRIGRKEKVL